MSESAKPVSATLLIIGDEVLSGKVDDSNSPFLIHSLRERGIELREVRVVPDVIATISTAVIELSQAATYLFTTGGIGPTHDDRTVEAIARGRGVEVARHPELLRRLHERYGAKLSAARLKLAEVPAGAVVHVSDENPIAVIQLDNIFIFPGVPSLMRLCFARIADHLGGTPIYSRALFLDVSESEAAGRIAEVQKRHPSVAVGSYPRFDAAPYRVKITVDGRDQGAVRRALQALVDAMDDAWLIDIDDG